MNEKFLKDRYKEWSNNYEFVHPGTPCGNELLAKADKASSSVTAELFGKIEKDEAWQIEEKYGSAFLMYTEAGFYAGYELACYMMRSMLVDDLTPPAPGEDHERA